MSEMSLFPGWEPPVAVVKPSQAEGLSADRRRTLRQGEAIAEGHHPLTGGPLHELASRHRDAASPKSDPFTCGSCYFRGSVRWHDGTFPKCSFGMTNETGWSGAPRFSHSSASDVRAWWPACPDYSPSDRLSSDAARHIPTTEPTTRREVAASTKESTT